MKMIKKKGPIDLLFIDADKEGYLDYLASSPYPSRRYWIMHTAWREMDYINAYSIKK